MDATVQSMIDSIARHRVLNSADHARMTTRWRKPGRRNIDDPVALARWLVINKFATLYQTDLLLSNRENELAVDQYQIVDQVLTGAATDCLEALDALGRPVMLQFMGPTHAPGAPAIARFLNQAKAATKPADSNLWRVLDHGVLGGRCYLVREAIRGETLTTLLSLDKPASPVTLARLLTRSLSALDALHQQGVSVGPISADMLAMVKGSGNAKRLKVLFQPCLDDGPVATPQEETFALCRLFYRIMAHAGTNRNEPRLLRPLIESHPDIPEALTTVMDTLIDTNATVRPRNAAMAAKALRIALASLEETEKPQVLDELEILHVPVNPKPLDEPEQEDDGLNWARPWLEHVGMTVREAACVAAGALGMILILLTALFAIGDLVPILALGLGAAGGVWIERWIRKQMKN